MRSEKSKVTVTCPAFQWLSCRPPGWEFRSLFSLSAPFLAGNVRIKRYRRIYTIILSTFALTAWWILSWGMWGTPNYCTVRIARRLECLLLVAVSLGSFPKPEEGPHASPLPLDQNLSAFVICPPVFQLLPLHPQGRERDLDANGVARLPAAAPGYDSGKTGLSSAVSIPS